MAEPSDVGLMPRTYFKLPRVPFDFRAVALGVLAYLAIWGGDILLSQLLTSSKVSVVGAFVTWFLELLQGLPDVHWLLSTFLNKIFQFAPPEREVKTLEIVVGGVWMFASLAFFGQAIRRIVALRIARDEGLSLREGLSFAAKNWFTMLRAPVVVGVAVGVFWFCNWLAGLVISVPVLGLIASLILVPLAVLSTLLLLLIALGGVLGMPLMGAAAAWERNGSLDAISRAFSYVFARPLQYFFSYVLVLSFTLIILFAGSWFVAAFARSVESGMLIDDRLAVAVNAPSERDDEGMKDLSKEAAEDWGRYRELTRYTGHPEGGMGADATAQPFVRDFDTVLNAPGLRCVPLFMFWLFVNLIWLGVFGYALFWFLGASCCIYADLRSDVDGTPEDEIHTDEDDQPIETGVGGWDLPPSSPPGGSAPTPPPPAAPASGDAAGPAGA
jgi:hypothetical protein